ncbi:MAG: DUF3035 domain-containing protein [Primorskyibacter sp.]
MTAMRAAVIVLAMLSLAACTAREGERTLTKFSKSREPEEFSILPRKPLSLPPSMRDLPAPDTSTGNRSDQTPLSDAVSALGGRATADGARPTSDSALIAAAGRFGNDPTIRTRLAAEDEVFRGSTRFTWQITRTNRYLRVYESQRLNPYAALDAFRKAGVSTPTAPPR